MDISINTIHRNLLDAGLPSTLEDLKSPTEAYVVNLLTTFLSRFGIDVSLIDQPIAEQRTAMMYSENSDVINLINLHAIVKPIFDKIFMHDFCLTDITSPEQKRLRRQAKFLSNFVLYTMHKKLELNDRMDQIQAKCRLLEELKEKKAQVLESINNKALHKANQLSLMRKLESDIQHTQSKVENNNERKLELEVTKNNVEKENQKAKEAHGSVKTAVGKLSKVIAELQSQIVHSPEKYQIRLNQLEKQKILKIEDRNVMQEAIQDKKQSIKQIEEKLNFILSMNNELVLLKDTCEELKDKRSKSDNIKKQIDSLNNTCKELQTKLTMHKDQMDTEMNELQSHFEKDITPLCNLYSQLLSEKKALKSKLETNNIIFNEKCLIRNKLQADIRKVEEDTSAFLHACQEVYDNEIINEQKLREGWMEE